MRIPTMVPATLPMTLLLGSLLLGGCGPCKQATAASAAPSAAAAQTSAIAPTPQSDGVTTIQLVKATHSWDGTPLPPYPQAQPEVTMLRITIPGGAKLPLHHHPVINAGILTRGRLQVVTTQGKELLLKAGDPIIEVVNTMHYGYNPDSEPAEIVVFYAGAEGTPLAVKQAATN